MLPDAREAEGREGMEIGRMAPHWSVVGQVPKIPTAQLSCLPPIFGYHFMLGLSLSPPLVPIHPSSVSY